MSKNKMTQYACHSLDIKEGRLLIEVELPRGRKKDVILHMSEDRFHVTPRFVMG
jgi:hypothetical protein